MDGVWQAAMVVLWLAVIFMAFLLAGALRQLGLMQLRLGGDPGALLSEEGLERGTVVPQFEALDVDTERMVKSVDLAPITRVLAFISTSCVACQKLIPHLNEVADTRRGEVDFLVICAGSTAQCSATKNSSNLGIRTVADQSTEIMTAFKVPATPFVYVVDRQGRVMARGVANDWRGLESLLEQEGTPQPGPWVLEAARTDEKPQVLQVKERPRGSSNAPSGTEV